MYLFSCWSVNTKYSREKSSFQVGVSPLLVHRIFDVLPLFHGTDLPHYYLTAKHPLQKFYSNTNAKRTEQKTEGERERQAKWYVPLLLRADRQTPVWFDHTVPSISLFILWWSITPFLSVSPVCLYLFLLHTHAAYTHFLGLLLFLFHLLLSPYLPFPNIFSSMFLFLFCLTTFEVCHSFCFVASYSLISTTAFVTLVQFHSQ